jgi:hypothetical protein
MELFYSSMRLLRIPYFWEDNDEMFNPAKSWDIHNPKYHVDGLKIFNFHPIYVYLNSEIPSYHFLPVIHRTSLSTNILDFNP